ncbi:hypothetical protein AVEN_266075-1 [Araneus ventricosus]|uniref:Uncharacterized protein n=1 Tax=Araneus ventricosus TaxID=182803 RepID=A0A4Y2PCI3_ARAVE|nr:hypothetical protein AVEN_266075-1 [Araneus ventricosus]
MAIPMKLAKLKNCCESSGGKTGATPFSRDSVPNLGSKHLSGARFPSESDVNSSCRELAQWTGRDFCQAELSKLDLRLDKCLNRFGDFVEK